MVTTVYHGQYIWSLQFNMASIYGHYSLTCQYNGHYSLTWPIHMVTTVLFTMASTYSRYSLLWLVHMVTAVYHGWYILSPQFTITSIYDIYNLPLPVYMVTTVYHGWYI